MNIPPQFQQSKAVQYAVSKGWKFKVTDSERIELEVCPLCKKDGYGHFYQNCIGNKDGVFFCHRCGEQGNLKRLKEQLGDKIENVHSTSDFSRSGQSDVEPLPDIEACHQALLENEDAMDYLVNVRGFSIDIIKKQKLGLGKRYFREVGDVAALIYPYLVGDNTVFVHYRTLPPADKAFSSPKGWDAPLYNGGILQQGLRELVLVEGEANTIAALDKGIKDIAGVPGANFKKAMWIDKLDKMESLEKIYICYDTDKVGQKAAQTLASRIGIERCYKLVLPDFEIPAGDGVTKPGKDLNEWFLYAGGNLEAFEKLKENAELFDVQGVANSGTALDEFEDFINGKKSLEPTYKTPWKSVNAFVGFEDGDVIDLVAREKIGKTTIGLNIMEYAVNEYGEDGIIICLEMTTARLVRKWVSHLTGTVDYIPKNKEEAEKLLENFKAAIPIVRKKADERPGELYFCYPQIKSAEDVYKLIVDCIRRYGVKWVMFDNLQLLCDRTLGSRQRSTYLSQISKALAAIAKDYNIKMLRILQPHRIADGQIITTDDVDGSAAIAKDCDVMITAHRNPLMELTQADLAKTKYIMQEEVLDPRLLLTIGLSRYSGGGRVDLEFNGATSTVSDYDENRIEMLKKATTPTTAEEHKVNIVGNLVNP